MFCNAENVRLRRRLVNLVEVASLLFKISDLLLIKDYLMGLWVDLLNALDLKLRLQQSRVHSELHIFDGVICVVAYSVLFECLIAWMFPTFVNVVDALVDFALFANLFDQIVYI